MDLCGKISIRFLAKVTNPASVDFSTRIWSRVISHGIKVSVLRSLDLVAASANLMSGCRVKILRRPFMSGSLIVRFSFVAFTDLHRVLMVGRLAVQARGSRREVKARSAGSIPH